MALAMKVRTLTLLYTVHRHPHAAPGGAASSAGMLSCGWFTLSLFNEMWD